MRVILVVPHDFNADEFGELVAMQAARASRIDHDTFYSYDEGCPVSIAFPYPHDVDTRAYAIHADFADIRMLEAFDYMRQFCPQIDVFCDGDYGDDAFDKSWSARRVDFIDDPTINHIFKKLSA